MEEFVGCRSAVVRLSFDETEWKRLRYIRRSIFATKEEKGKEEKSRAHIELLSRMELIPFAGCRLAVGMQSTATK